MSAKDNRASIKLKGSAPLQIFPFVGSLHCEVVLRHMDGESQDIEMSPNEADRVADLIRNAAAAARALQRSDELDPEATNRIVKAPAEAAPDAGFEEADPNPMTGRTSLYRNV